MPPSARRLFKRKRWVFQKDNDPKHTAKLTKKWFIDNKVEKEVWPAQSPDLNPIENLWSILDDRCKKRKPQTPEELFEMLEEGWNSLPVDLLERLCDSMPARCAAVTKSRGFATKY
jgi:hypothetical protein